MIQNKLSINVKNGQSLADAVLVQRLGINQNVEFVISIANGLFAVTLFSLNLCTHELTLQSSWLH